jgi:hypothetical protein
VVAAVGLLDQLPVVLPFQGTAREVHAFRVASPFRLVQIGVGDDGQAASDQVVVNISLALQLLLFAKLLRKPTFHLAKT